VHTHDLWGHSTIATANRQSELLALVLILILVLILLDLGA
jgi:hypothetical protein